MPARDQVIKEREEQEAFSALPEMQAFMKEMARKHWKKWLNEPVPVLMGKNTKTSCEVRRRA